MKLISKVLMLSALALSSMTALASGSDDATVANAGSDTAHVGSADTSADTSADHRL